jgi:hypothetical protein
MGGRNKKPKKKCVSLAQRIEVSSSTAWKICRDDLSLYQYKMQVSKPLEDGIMRLYTFATEYGALLEGSPRMLHVTWFSAEVHFYLDSYIGKKYLVMGLKNPKLPFHCILREF